MNLSENLTTVFKEAYTDEIKKAVVAFANTAGGHIYIGIGSNYQEIQLLLPLLLYTI